MYYGNVGMSRAIREYRTVVRPRATSAGGVVDDARCQKPVAVVPAARPCLASGTCLFAGAQRRLRSRATVSRGIGDVDHRYSFTCLSMPPRGRCGMRGRGSGLWLGAHHGRPWARGKAEQVGKCNILLQCRRYHDQSTVSPLNRYQSQPFRRFGRFGRKDVCRGNGWNGAGPRLLGGCSAA